MQKIDLKKSKNLAAYISLIHAGGCACFLPLPFNILIKIVLTLFCLASFVYALKRYVLLKSLTSIIQIWQEKDGLWRLKKKNGEICKAKLSGNSVITSHFSLLGFEVDGKKYKLIKVPIFSDSLNVDEYHQILILRWQTSI